MIDIIIIIFYTILCFILPTIILFKQKKCENNHNLINSAKFLGMTLIFILLCFLAQYIFDYNSYTIKECGSLCIERTNHPIFLLLGLTIQLISTTIYYLMYKKLLLKTSNFIRYIYPIIYFSITTFFFVFSSLIYISFFGPFVIKNIFLNIYRYLVFLFQVLIYPLDMYLYLLKKKFKKN